MNVEGIQIPDLVEPRELTIKSTSASEQISVINSFPILMGMSSGIPSIMCHASSRDHCASH
jgi:hypothetical protein